MKHSYRTLLLLLLSLFATNTIADIKVISWNVESGGASPPIFSRHFADMDDIDFYGLSEVTASWENQLVQNISRDETITYASILGTTGGADRLQIIYNSDRYDLVSSDELNDININGRVRAPLIGTFKDKETNVEFIVMVNHLYRSNEGARHQQATLINQWATSQPIPVIALGDFNFDWDVENGENDHDDGYDNMTANDVFKWVQPPTLMKTQCSPRYNSVLDFVFVSHSFRTTTNSSEILLTDNDYCTTNTDNESDHRPIYASIGDGNAPQVPPSTKQQLLHSIQIIEIELAALKLAVQSTY